MIKTKKTLNTLLGLFMVGPKARLNLSKRHIHFGQKIAPLCKSLRSLGKINKKYLHAYTTESCTPQKVILSKIERNKVYKFNKQEQ